MILVLVAASLGVLLVLLCAVLGGKLARDGRERRSRHRRAMLHRALVEHDPAPIRRAVRVVRQQSDLLSVLAIEPEGMGHGGVLADVLDPVRDGLVAQLRARHAHRRGAAALLLAHLGAGTATDAIGDLLRDRDGDVRLAACAALALLASPAGARRLIDELDGGSIHSGRLIERLAGDWAVPTMLESLDGPGPPPTRAALLRALGLAGDRRALAVVRNAVVTGSAEERISAARSLGALGTREDVVLLTRTLTDPEWAVRAQAARALGALGAGVPGLEAAMTDDAWWVRTNAAQALRGLGGAGVAALHRVADSDDRFAAERAAEALSLAVTPHALELVA